MPASIVWLDQARDDIHSIIANISLHNPPAAKTCVKELLESCRILEQFPLGGPAWNDRYRTLAVRNHLIFYRFDVATGGVTIVALLDGRRDLEQVMGVRTAK